MAKTNQAATEITYFDGDEICQVSTVGPSGMEEVGRVIGDTLVKHAAPDFFGALTGIEDDPEYQAIRRKIEVCSVHKPGKRLKLERTAQVIRNKRLRAVMLGGIAQVEVLELSQEGLS